MPRAPQARTSTLSKPTPYLTLNFDGSTDAVFEAEVGDQSFYTLALNDDDSGFVTNGDRAIFVRKDDYSDNAEANKCTNAGVNSLRQDDDDDTDGATDHGGLIKDGGGGTHVVTVQLDGVTDADTRVAVSPSPALPRTLYTTASPSLPPLHPLLPHACSRSCIA